MKGPARRALAILIGLPALALACSPAPYHPPRTAQAEASPLGPSFVLLPVPNEDDSLLGRVLYELPEAGRSIEETSRPNPCLAALEEPRRTPMANSYEDAQDVSVNAQARAMLGVFGFSGDANSASHFVYKLSTDQRVARTDTTDYQKCCAETQGCGIGFVSALIHGEGQYATGEETAAQGAVTVPMAGVGGGVRLKVLHKRNVKGYIAAMVTLTDDGKKNVLGPLGIAAVEPTVPERVRVEYEQDKVRIHELPNGEWMFLTARNGAITENEFARRYQTLTGDTDLKPVEQRRNTTAVVVTGALTAASLYGVYWSATNLTKPCTKDELGCVEHNTSPAKPQPPGTECTQRDESTGVCQSYVDPNETTTNVWGIVGLSVLSPIALLTGSVFIVSLVNGDGMPDSHVLNQDDARLYVTRYNRAVLRKSKDKIRHQVQIEQRAGVKLMPYAGPSGLGVFGRF